MMSPMEPNVIGMSRGMSAQRPAFRHRKDSLNGDCHLKKKKISRESRPAPQKVGLGGVYLVIRMTLYRLCTIFFVAQEFAQSSQVGKAVDPHWPHLVVLRTGSYY